MSVEMLEQNSQSSYLESLNLHLGACFVQVFRNHNVRNVSTV